MKRSKKLLSLLLAVSMLTACAVGCGKEETSGTQTSESAQSNETTSTVVEETPLYNVGSLPIVNEEITLKVLTCDVTNKAWETADKSAYWEWLTEKTGIKFEVESYAKEELASKLALIMATPDEMPDIFFNVGFSAADVMNYGLNGQLLMLDDYIEEYGTNTKEAFKIEGVAGGAKAADGHIYSLPSVSSGASDVIYVLNSRFMENAGLDAEKDAPKTIEELYEVFKAIQKSDANGDGIVGNEICWSTTPDCIKRSGLSMIGVSCYWPWEGCIFEAKDDDVYFVPTSEEYKYLLSWLHSIYAEGMLDNEVFTQTSEQRTAKLKSDLVFMSHTYNDPEQSSSDGRTGAFFLDAPLTSAVSDTPIVPMGAIYAVDIAAISAYTEYPEVCMLLLDYIYSDEASKVAAYGLEGVDYIIDANGFLESASTEFTKRNGPTTFPVNVWRRDTDWFKQGETTLAKDRREYDATYGKMGWQNYMKFTSEESDSIAVLGADLGLYCDDYWVNVITGNYDLEKTWDEYVKKCESMNVDKLIELYQNAYNRFYGLN